MSIGLFSKEKVLTQHLKFQPSNGAWRNNFSGKFFHDTAARDSLFSRKIVYFNSLLFFVNKSLCTEEKYFFLFFVFSRLKCIRKTFFKIKSQTRRTRYEVDVQLHVKYQRTQFWSWTVDCKTLELLSREMVNSDSSSIQYRKSLHKRSKGWEKLDCIGSQYQHVARLSVCKTKLKIERREKFFSQTNRIFTFAIFNKIIISKLINAKTK